ncbi:glycosyltransferase family 17 protein [Vararia minispora EC-137]|uniref:Glycosyltransferase family 17 protein n=1 Tax=Vararia minispora EC-137 TaxID=1314806 RepID=A0ACB8QB76_9AGAM|nr:glycosyltransferase family 17 protein [Vararia minispora EC-137]
MLAGRRRFLVLFAAVGFSLVFFTYNYWAHIRNTLSYASRPLWDSPDGPREIIPHYHADGLEVGPDVCALHGWAPRAQEAEAWDAVLFSGELDLLEIRLHELSGVVDRFFILESNRTFTGRPKPLVFADARARFAHFEDRIVYEALEGPQAADDGTEEDPWKWEAYQRNTMTALLKAHLARQPRAPLVLFSDVDEIPAAHTLRLVKRCAAPSPLHLQMRTFLYSFEWPVGWGSWRAQVHEWAEGTYYRHSMAGMQALADAGWHCSYCFRRLSEFADKMQGFSHADRLNGDASLLEPRRIQQVVCEGKDIFGMLPEAYSYKDMIQLMNPEPSRSMTSIPKYLIENAARFKFLLPGGCEREA